MRLLLVYPFLPYPPDDGGRIGFFNPIKYLSRQHEVAIICLSDGSDDEAGAGELKKFCAEVRTHRRSKPQDLYRILRGTVAWPPGSAAKYWIPKAGHDIRAMAASWKPDLVEFHHLNTAAYTSFVGDVPKILREHNVEYKVWERFSQNASSWAEGVYAKWAAPRVRRYEGKISAQFDRCVVVSEADAAHLKRVSPKARIEVIPSGVDTEYFRPLADCPEEPFSITVTGSYKWRPRQRSLLVLLTDVFPRLKAKLPGATLSIVGKGMPESIERIARDMPGVTVTGRVPDVRPYIAKSALLINYLETGGGIALKVLEAMAMKKPVLSTSLGCEGIAVTHGKEAYIADGPEEFASAAACLLQNSAIRDEIAENGHRAVLGKYSWNSVASRLTACYSMIVEEHRHSRQNSTEGVEISC